MGIDGSHLRSQAEAPAHEHGYSVPHRIPFSTVSGKTAAITTLPLFAARTAVCAALLSTAFGVWYALGTVRVMAYPL